MAILPLKRHYTQMAHASYRSDVKAPRMSVELPQTDRHFSDDTIMSRAVRTESRNVKKMPNCHSKLYADSQGHRHQLASSRLDAQTTPARLCTPASPQGLIASGTLEPTKSVRHYFDSAFQEILHYRNLCEEIPCNIELMVDVRAKSANRKLGLTVRLWPATQDVLRKHTTRTSSSATAIASASIAACLKSMQT